MLCAAKNGWDSRGMLGLVWGKAGMAGQFCLFVWGKAGEMAWLWAFVSQFWGRKDVD
jgi:hypothetical protein